ncbi:MAG: hypothetical protein IJG63_06935 [Oscillospiraceae bacterium]|nr:hypothetical protein [Oscillospiraceae bacterium]
MKRIDTGGISYFDKLEGSGEWLWGMDYCSGDMYEAEELYHLGHRIKQNRLLFLHCPDGRMLEPVKAKQGQYLGRPVFEDGHIHLLLADFPAGVISILRYDETADICDTVAEIPYCELEDCYNLLLKTSPLTLTRQPNGGRFQIIWPVRREFAIGETETFDFRKGNRLYFAQWFEDPDYREELVIRSFDSGEIIERHRGTLMRLPNGDEWLLE